MNEYQTFQAKMMVSLCKFGGIMEFSKINKVKTKNDFLDFLEYLRADYLENISSWENRDIGTFLEAMASWIRDMDGFYIHQGLPVPEKPDWKVFADILMGGKLYE